MADIRVTIFDDNKRILESLGLLFSETDGFYLAGTFNNCTDLLANIELTQPDVVLMDIDIPGINGIEGVKILRRAHPELQILMLTVFDDEQKIFEAIVAGANGYILKNRSLERLVEAVKEVQAGGSPMSPAISRKVLKLFQQQHVHTPLEDYKLSAREKEVLALLVKGASYKMAGDQLKIGYDTVHTHIKNIYKKLRVNSMSEAVAKAIHNKIV